MNWILENLQLILVVAGAIAVWLNNRQREKEGLPTDYDEDGVPENPRPPARAEQRELAPISRDGTDPEQEERVRRIQEEIRRKILERRGQGANPTAMPPMGGGDPFRPVFQEIPPPLPQPSHDAGPVAPLARADASAQEAILERQRALAEQLRQLEERRREAVQAALGSARGAGGLASADAVRGVTPVARAGTVGGSLADDFRDPRALRRALVWREVLGPPLALR